MHPRRPMHVHIGLPKTGTTTLQRGLFARHPEIEFLGKRAGGRGNGHRRQCASESAYRLANRLFWDPAASIDVAEARHIYADELRPTLPDVRIPLYSFEGIAVEGFERRCAVARNLRNVFEDCRVVVGIRRPVDLVESMYFHRLSQRHFGRRAGRLEFLGSPSPEAWLEAVVAGEVLSNHLDYARTIRVFADALGYGRVGVFPLERLESEPRAFARDLCTFLGIDTAAGERLLARRWDNRRIPQRSFERMRRFGRAGAGVPIYALAGRRLRKGVLGLGRRSVAGARLPIRASFREAMALRTRDGHRWIEAQWGLSLGEYGYPL